MTAPLALPGFLQRKVEAEYQRLLQPEGGPDIDFSRPSGAPALAAPDSVSWQVFKNPLTLFIGGVTAVILELGEARVRAGVWDHTSFRTDPVTRLRRTGMAAMVTVYGAREVAEAMIAGVSRAHERVQGMADDGRPYRASDVELLDWVQATASFGFVEAYHQFARALDDDDYDRFFEEAVPAARLYGAQNSPRSRAQWSALLAQMTPRLTPSPIIQEFLEIMRRAPAMPGLARPALQPLLVRAAVSLVPAPVRARLGLEGEARLTPSRHRLLRTLGATPDRLYLPSSPPAHASLRLGLPGDWLYRSR